MRTTTAIALRLSAACLLASILSVLAACASAPPDAFYTLSASAAATTSPQKPGAYSVALGQITLPELVDRPQLVVRSSANRVTILEHQRWAESLKGAITHVLAADLSTQLGGVTVAVRGDNASRDAKYVVLVDITTFDSVQNEAATLEATWSVRAMNPVMGANGANSVNGGILRSGKATVREPTQEPSVDALVAAHERALARLSAEIALSVRAAESGTH